MSDPVLCPELYNRLIARFGTVLVANNMEEMFGERVRVDSEHRKMVVHHAGEYYRVNCPFCMETRKRLWVNHRFAEFPWLCHCFNETDCMSGSEGRSRRQRLTQMIFHTAKPALPMVMAGRREEDGPLVGVELPGEVVPLSDLDRNHRARRYLYHRGYDPDALSQDYGVGFIEHVDDPGQHRLLEGRIFIPIIMRGDMVGWQGRWPDDLPWKDVRMQKYYNLKGMPKKRMLYNFDVASQFNTVVVVEGVSDVWSVGPCAVSLLGSSLNQLTQGLISTTWRGGTCVMYLDGDASDKNAGMALELRNEFKKNGGRVVVVTLPPDKDPGDLTFEANWGMIRAQAASQGVVIN